MSETHCLTGHSNVVECVEMSSPGGALDLQRGMVAAAAASSSASVTPAASPMFAISGDRNCTVMVWDVLVGSCVASLSGHGSWVRGVSFHPCGTLAVSVAEDQTLRVWDIPRRVERSVLEGVHEDVASCVAVHPSLPLVVTGATDGSLKVWECN
jgi:WD40 repeat protein